MAVQNPQLAEPTPIPIISAPGIKRDGTRFEGDNWTDGRWTRFQRGRPRKIGGVRQLTDELDGLGRGIEILYRTGNAYIHIGTSTGLQRMQLNLASGLVSSPVTRTLTGYTDDANQLWTMAGMYDAVSTADRLIVHPSMSALDITDETENDIFIGDPYDVAALTSIASSACSGGIVILFPYLVYFGNSGLIGNSVPNDPTDLTNAGSNKARVCRDKIVAGRRMRAGPGNAPAGLFWSLTEVVRATFVGGTAVFNFDTLAEDLPLFCKNGIVSYDGLFLWITEGRFMMFDGTVHEIPNAMNLNWFFKNVNNSQRNKIHAFPVPRFGEVWWCFPFGDATEPTHAIIYNLREQTWYDTELAPSGRTASAGPGMYPFPVTTDSDLVSGKSRVWQHEIGTDAVYDPSDSGSLSNNAIRAFIETADLSFLAPPGGSPGKNFAVEVTIMEPDFVQAGPLEISMIGKANPRAADAGAVTRTLQAVAATPQDQIAGFNTQNRLMRFRFQSNAAGGDFQFGQPMVHIRAADQTVLGATE